jgi:hypothetical protein
LAFGLLFREGIMHRKAALIGLVRALAVSLALWASGLCLVGSEATVTRTNWFDHWITNVIEVRMPANRFVNEYHTNWVTQLRTNVVDVFATNRVMRLLTNAVVVDAFHTNVVVAYQTNWQTRTLTNQVAVNVLRTNFVDQYRTNLSTLNLTNWETVILFQTNWTTLPVTNVVRIDLPARSAAPAATPNAVAEPKEVRTETASPASASAWTGPLALEAVRTARPAANNLIEVQLKVRWTGNSATPLQVQNWRVEREDGAVLVFGQDQEFKRQLPIGKYKVEAKVRTEGDSLPLTARGTLSVTSRDAVIQQRQLVKK